jgi:hypothetical protein
MVVAKPIRLMGHREELLAMSMPKASVNCRRAIPSDDVLLLVECALPAARNFSSESFLRFKATGQALAYPMRLSSPRTGVKTVASANQ